MRGSRVNGLASSRVAHVVVYYLRKQIHPILLVIIIGSGSGESKGGVSRNECVQHNLDMFHFRVNPREEVFFGRTSLIACFCRQQG